MKAPRWIWTVGGGLALGICIGWSVAAIFSPSSLTSGGKQVRQNEGQYTNPLLECDVAAGSIDAQKQNFDTELEKYAAAAEQNAGVEKIGVYFRDMNNGPAFGYNEDTPFIPASLLKLPVMMAYYKKAESDPGVLDEKVTVPASVESADIQQLVPPAERITVGSVHTVEDLITRMVTYSDNQSLIALFDSIPSDELAHLYSLLGMSTDVISDPSASLTVKQYSSFFRILFNASFLTQAYSEKALGHLTNSAFTQALRSGVPEPVPVAHKFGERTIEGSQQLHDCGIVYYPKHPYLLCVMTRGNDIAVLEKTIADISKFVYEKIDAQYSL